MTRLSARDRAKVNAGLILLHNAGQDVGEVTRLASIALASGTPPRMAYDRAFNKFVERVPSFRAPLQRIGQLIENTDHQTLARYNVGMAQFIETGDRAHLDAIMPTVEHDLAQMAEITGDAGFAEGLTDPAPAPAPEHTPEAPQTPTGPGWSHTGYRPSEAPAQASDSEVAE